VATETEYRAALDNDDFALIEKTYSTLPYRERMVIRVVAAGIEVGQACAWYDRFFSLLPGEGLKGPWRILIKGQAVFYGWDDYGTYLPDVPEEDRRAIKEAGILWW
jgi:hypothetical protein